MRQSSAILFLHLLLAPACSGLRTHQRPLPLAEVAEQMGPMREESVPPKVLLASAVDLALMEELVPYVAQSISHASGGTDVPAEDAASALDACAREITQLLLPTRPDAILIIEGQRHSSAAKGLSFTPVFGLATIQSAKWRTEAVAYAMRATRARLPMQYDWGTGTVVAIRDAAAAGSALQVGDVLDEIAGHPATPPTHWPAWPRFESSLLGRPGDDVSISWNRQGVGRMSGVVKLIQPAAPHLRASDCIDTSRIVFRTTKKSPPPRQEPTATSESGHD